MKCNICDRENDTGFSIESHGFNFICPECYTMRISLLNKRKYEPDVKIILEDRKVERYMDSEVNTLKMFIKLLEKIKNDKRLKCYVERKTGTIQPFKSTIAGALHINERSVYKMADPHNALIKLFPVLGSAVYGYSKMYKSISMNFKEVDIPLPGMKNPGLFKFFHNACSKYYNHKYKKNCISSGVDI